MSISLRLSDKDATLFRTYAEMKHISLSELIRQTVMERIEDEFDLNAYSEAMADYVANPVTYKLDEVEKELGLS